MIANPLLRKVVQTGYVTVRTPLAALDRALPRGSSAGRFVDRSVHILDGLVSGALSRPAQPAETPAPPAPADESTPMNPPEEVVEAIREQQADVGELADPELDVAEVQAQLRAKHLLEEQREAEQLRKAGRR